MKFNIAVLVGLSIAPLACGGSNTASIGNQGLTMTVDTPRTEWIDSALSAEDAMRRFRADIPAPVTQYSDGASSRDALVRKFVDNVAKQDTVSLARLAVSRGEFAYLYYPNHPQSRPPYELTPQLMWFQMTANSDKGLRRLLRDFGGQQLPVNYSCADSAEIQNGNRIWTKCVVETGADVKKRVALFSAILERQGTYKFLSYTNSL